MSYPWLPLTQFYVLMMFFSFNHIVLTLLCLSLLTSYKFCMIGFADMVNEKWLNNKVASGESFQGLSWDQEDMRNNKLYLGVLTLVNQSGFNNHLYVFSMNLCGPRWRGWSWSMKDRFSIWDEGVACDLWHLFTSKHALIFTFNAEEIRSSSVLWPLDTLVLWKVHWGDSLRRERVMVSFWEWSSLED